MSDLEEPVASTSKAKTLQRPKVQVMVDDALNSLDNRSGSSMIAVKKSIAAMYLIDVQKISTGIKKYIKESIASGKYVQTKGKGVSGSFRLSPAVRKEANAKPKAKKEAATKKESGGKKKATESEKKQAKKKVTLEEGEEEEEEEVLTTKKSAAKKGPTEKKPKKAPAITKTAVEKKVKKKEIPAKGKEDPAEDVPLKSEVTEKPKKATSSKKSTVQVKKPPKETVKSASKGAKIKKAPIKLTAKEADSTKATESKGATSETESLPEKRPPSTREITNTDSETWDAQEPEEEPEEGFELKDDPDQSDDDEEEDDSEEDEESSDEESSDLSARTAAPKKSASKLRKSLVKRKSLATLARGSKPGKFSKR